MAWLNSSKERMTFKHSACTQFKFVCLNSWITLNILQINRISALFFERIMFSNRNFPIMWHFKDLTARLKQLINPSSYGSFIWIFVNNLKLHFKMLFTICLIECNRYKLLFTDYSSVIVFRRVFISRQQNLSTNVFLSKFNNFHIKTIFSKWLEHFCLFDTLCVALNWR